MERVSSISMAKGVAIILMVLAHTQFSLYGDHLIAMFHMPLFFFLSGYCFKEKHLLDAKRYVIKKLKSVYLPFAKWSLIFLAMHNILSYLNVYNNTYTISEYVKRAFHIVTAMQDFDPLLGGFWFLRTLMWASIFSFFLIKIAVKSNWRALAYLVECVCLLVVCSLMNYLKLHIPYFYVGERELLASFFITTGWMYKNAGLKIEENKIIIPILTLFVIIGSVIWPCSMITLETWKILPYSISALAGTLAIFGICKVLEKWGGQVLKYIGDNTLTILIWHFSIFKVVSALIIWIYGLPLSTLCEFPVIKNYSQNGWWVVYLVLGVSIPSLMSKVNVLKK